MLLYSIINVISLILGYCIEIIMVNILVWRNMGIN